MQLMQVHQRGRMIGRSQIVDCTDVRGGGATQRSWTKARWPMLCVVRTTSVARFRGQMIGRS
jgi:hypothetical protein